MRWIGDSEAASSGQATTPMKPHDDHRYPALFGERSVEELSGARMDAVVHRKWLEQGDAGRLFDLLLAETEWSQRETVLFGKQVTIPRLTAWYGDPDSSYRYSGIDNSPLPWTPALEGVRDRVGALACEEFNSVLLNLYRDGADGVAWHSDDERELGLEPVIGSLSLGATRRFHLRPKDGSAGTLSIDLAHGDLLVMRGSTQQAWLHQVPKTRRKVGQRINLTFRRVLGGP